MRLWFRRPGEAELEKEIRFHLEMEIERRMNEGLSRGEAELSARRDFGNVGQTKEIARSMWGSNTVERILQDLRYAARSLAHTPAFSATAVLSLALGIGANVASFSLADTFLLRPLPVERPGEVVAITGQTAQNPFDNVSYPAFRDIRDRTHSFSGVAGYQLARFAFAPSLEVVPRMKFGMEVTEGFFSILGVHPALGRTFSDEEAKVAGRGAVVVLGHDFWQLQFAGDTRVAGRVILINGSPFTIVGVAPEEFTGMDPFLRPAFFVPIAAAEGLNPSGVTSLENRADRRLSLRARLKLGIAIEQAQAELSSTARALAQEYPSLESDRELRARSELQLRIRQSPAAAVSIAMLLVLSGAVLAIACANVAGLLLARSRARSREVAIRLAIGAGRGRLLQQFLTESVVVAMAGGVAGVALAFGSIRYLSSIRLPTDTPIVIAPQLDWRVLLFALLVSAASAVLFGLVPALRTVRPELVPALKDGETSGKQGSNRGRNFLVGGQVAISLVLLVTSATLLDGFRRMLILDPGIRTDHLMMLEFDPPLIGYSPEQTTVFYRQLMDRTRTLPGVRSATLTRSIPFRPNFTEEAIVPEQYEFPRNESSVTVSTSPVDESYFETVGTEIVDGRAFSASDTASSRRVGIVNQEFARRYWPGRNAIGKRFRMGTNGPTVEVVGVAKTGKYLALTESPTPYIYVPFAQNPQSRMALLVRTEGAPAAITDAVLGVVRAIDANQPVFNVRVFSDYYEQGVLGVALITLQMAGTIGLTGLGLALVGLYGLIAYSVSRRTREIGIRMAIGAGRSSVMKLVLGQGLMLAVSGILAGLVLSVPAFRLLGSALAGVGGASAWTLVIVPLLLVLLSMLAYGLPAWKAARIDPVNALRQQ